MASNDPTNTGGLFIGRRPGTAPYRYRERPITASTRRRRTDSWLAAGILMLEAVVCSTLWGPQPIAWLWVGSQVDYLADSIVAGIVTAFVGMLFTLMATLAIAMRLDHAWRLVRRAAGYDQREGLLDRIFVVSIAIAGSVFLFWFFIIAGPGPQLAPWH